MLEALQRMICRHHERSDLYTRISEITGVSRPDVKLVVLAICYTEPAK